MKVFARFFVAQAVNYLLVVINGRAFTHLQYFWTAVTDFSICLLSWYMLKKMVDAEGWDARIGYAAGGAAGSLFGMWLTKGWGA